MITLDKQKESSMKNLRLAVVSGARPNFVKIAPLIHELDRHNARTTNRVFDYSIIHTGQHYDYAMSRVFFNDLDIQEPDEHLGVGSGSHAEQTGKVMIELEKVLVRDRPDIVLVVGDVNSTLAASLVSVKLGLPIAHIESGIRSYDRSFPEEINRYITDHLSAYCFTTSGLDDSNLVREGISKENIFCVGNIMVDCLYANMAKAKQRRIVESMALNDRGYILLTLHRPSNVDNEQTLRSILSTMLTVSEEVSIMFPVHPRTMKRINEFDLGGLLRKKDSGFRVIEPLGYLDFISLEMSSRAVVTDSGGIQVETTILGVPCLTLLPVPAWPITHELGTNRLIGNDMKKLTREIGFVLEGEDIEKQQIDLWDGNTAKRIVEILSKDRM